MIDFYAFLEEDDKKEDKKEDKKDKKDKKDKNIIIDKKKKKNFLDFFRCTF